MEEVLGEYETWLGGQTIPPNLKSRYETALKKRDAVMQYEEALVRMCFNLLIYSTPLYTVNSKFTETNANC